MVFLNSEEKLLKRACTQSNVKKTVKCLGCQIARNKTISSFDAQDFVNGKYHYCNCIPLLLTTYRGIPGAVDFCKREGIKSLKKLKVKKQSRIKGLFHH
jgi:hypothetical protein